MTPDEFLRTIPNQTPAPVYLFIGPEPYQRAQCKRALLERCLAPGEREEGFTRYDLDESDLVTILDDAQSLSLFSPRRLIWAGSAEAALPRTRGTVSDDDSDAGSKSATSSIAAYLKNPAPGTVIVFEVSRYEFEGDDKAKVQRVLKFYSCVPVQVEFPRYSPAAAQKLARELAKKNHIRIGSEELDLLVDALGSDASRITIELEKLSLYAGSNRNISSDDIRNLVPNAQASTIFTLVAAIGRSDRTASLESLDVLVKEGEYLPLALTFLATQFRLALIAREAGLQNAGQILSHFTKLGTPMWRSRAEQVQQTAAAFNVERLKAAIQRIYETDKALRDTRPDDRIVMEQFVLGLTR
ncbi:MAG TPA: DNA polymerase III subunit delta [Bryobacteraceae bacterium]|nr:DNA polymerase III subunit delta [Bryobacteraceae bacterium]